MLTEQVCCCGCYCCCFCLFRNNVATSFSVPASLCRSRQDCFLMSQQHLPLTLRNLEQCFELSNVKVDLMFRCACVGMGNHYISICRMRRVENIYIFISFFPDSYNPGEFEILHVLEIFQSCRFPIDLPRMFPCYLHPLWKLIAIIIIDYKNNYIIHYCIADRRQDAVREQPRQGEGGGEFHDFLWYWLLKRCAPVLCKTT